MKTTMNRMGYRALLSAAAALVAVSHATPVAAQTTFWACRVPAVGVLYMIADSAAICLDGAHVKFSWTDGGAPPDGSITSAKLADGAVTNSKIADGAVNTVRIADGSVNSAKLVDAGVATADLANGAVTIAKLSGGGAPVSGYEYVQTTGVAVGANNGWSINSPNCPSGKMPIAGGFQAPYTSAGTLMYLFGDRPQSNYWNLFIYNGNATSQNVTTWTLCAQVTATSAS
jgi:hypothetical protein